MSVQIKDKKTIRQKRCKNSKDIAYVCGCKVRMVNAVLSGERGNKMMTKLAEKIEVATALLEEKNRKTLEEVKQIIDGNN